jgi:hypothetical protein|tara:strand:- start:868 stop:2664 length:1797 start_codon:yes stop_codon:yes gene_type:complete
MVKRGLLISLFLIVILTPVVYGDLLTDCVFQHPEVNALSEEYMELYRLEMKAKSKIGDAQDSQGYSCDFSGSTSRYKEPCKSLWDAYIELDDKGTEVNIQQRKKELEIRELCKANVYFWRTKEEWACHNSKTYESCTSAKEICKEPCDISLDNYGSCKDACQWTFLDCAQAEIDACLRNMGVDTCSNGKLDGDEEDIDCGGDCPPCDTCFNKKQDSEEEGIDCGGPCMARCSFDTTISPSKVTLAADGRAKQEFILTAKSSGSPLKNERFSLSLWFPFKSEVMDNYGNINLNTVDTDSNGQATFTYSAPRAPDGYYLENLNFEVRANGKTGTKAQINLIDPKPKIILKLDQRSMLEDSTQMNFADVEIIDEDSKEWDIKVTTSIGTLVPTGRGGNFITLIDKTKEKDYHFNWNPPESAVELIESTLAYVADHRTDWNNYQSNLKNSAADSALGLGVPDSVLKSKGYKDQMNNWKGNVDQMQRDLDRMKTSTSNYERFLRSLSLGLEGLQTFYGTKGFVEGEFESSGDDPLAFLKKVRDNTLDYGVDSLQSGLRYWAGLVREGSLDTVRIPVHIVVEVTDDQGFKTKKGEVFQYTYHIT